MPRICKTCIHPLRDNIETALLNGETIASVAAKYGLSDDSVHRHLKNGHLRDRIASAPPVSGHVDIDGIMGIYGKQLLRIQTLAAELDASAADGGLIEPKDRISVQRELRQTIDSIVKAVPLQQKQQPPEQTNTALDSKLDAALEAIYTNRGPSTFTGPTSTQAGPDSPTDATRNDDSAEPGETSHRPGAIPVAELTAGPTVSQR